MWNSAARARARRNAFGPVVAAAFTGAAILGLTACAQPATGTPTPGSTATVTVATSQPAAVPAPPPSTVYVQPPATRTVTDTPGKPLTPCEHMYASGYSYDMAYAAWLREGSPLNWDADRDGLPCEQSYGQQN
jgi:hypothetical protein